MARRIILSDDLTGNESEDVKTHLFMVDNVFYEVDFSDDSFELFEKALGKFIKVSCETRRITATAKGEASQSEKIRQWAKANGIDVAERGRLPEDVIEKYDKAHSNGESTTTNQGETDSPNLDETVKTDSDGEASQDVSEKVPAGSNRNKR